MAPSESKELIDEFHRFYYDSEAWQNTYWLGVPTLKCPFDMWVYQEVIFETKPDLIIECGTYGGGSALFMASLLDIIGSGRIITIDIEPRDNYPEHDRIQYLAGSSVDESVIAQVGEAADGLAGVMVILDSDHTEEHVARELQAYAPMVTPGDYLVVEDTNINGNPVYPGFGPGPAEALRAFLRENSSFEVDHSREKFFVSFNPGGWLRRIVVGSQI